MVDNICESVCNILKNRSDIISQQKKDVLKEIENGRCSQAIINNSINLDGKTDIIADIVINLDRRNICKCSF